MFCIFIQNSQEIKKKWVLSKPNQVFCVTVPGMLQPNFGLVAMIWALMFYDHTDIVSQKHVTWLVALQRHWSNIQVISPLHVWYKQIIMVLQANNKTWCKTGPCFFFAWYNLSNRGICWLGWRIKQSIKTGYKWLPHIYIMPLFLD